MESIPSYIIEVVIVFIVTVVLTTSVSYVIKYFAKGKREAGERKLEKLKLDYPELFKADSDYAYFTTGHPYVWVEIDFDGFMRIIEHGLYIDDGNGNNLYPAFSYEIDEEKRNFYIVGQTNNFDFSTLMHYDEWMESQRSVAENIAKYKARNQ